MKGHYNVFHNLWFELDETSLASVNISYSKQNSSKVDDNDQNQQITLITEWHITSERLRRSSFIANFLF